MITLVRSIVFAVGLLIFSLGIALAVQVQYLGIHPWEVLNVGFYNIYGLSIGSWSIIISVLLIGVTFILDKSYIQIGTFLNAFIVGFFVDLFLMLDFLPHASNTWTDIILIIISIVMMGIGGGINNGARIGAGPRDGFMLSISDKLSVSIRIVRIVTESSVVLIGLLIGGPVFLFTFLYTFIQSPIFQAAYLRVDRYITQLKARS